MKERRLMFVGFKDRNEEAEDAGFSSDATWFTLTTYQPQNFVYLTWVFLSKTVKHQSILVTFPSFNTFND